MNESTMATRDRLALRRTHLANERTLLAYFRTAIMLAASGVALLKLPSRGSLDFVLAAVLLAGGLIVAVVATHRFRRTRRALVERS